MKMMKLAGVLALALFAAGCQPKLTQKEAVYEDTAQKVELAPPGGAGTSDHAAQPAAAPLLAYSYQYSVEAPSAQVPALLHKHEQACTAAGAALCQVVGERTTALGRDAVEGRLELRAEPRWLAHFRAGLESDARQAGGRLTGSSVETEDLTRSIVDTDAELRSKRALRDRLQALLQRPSSNIKDLLETEKELSRVQGEIDAAESELAVMRTRVQTSKLEIEYSSVSRLAPESAFSPLSDASHNFLRNLMQSLAALLSIIAFLAPFALVVAASAWIWLRSRRSRRSKKTPPAA